MLCLPIDDKPYYQDKWVISHTKNGQQYESNHISDEILLKFKARQHRALKNRGSESANNAKQPDPPNSTYKPIETCTTVLQHEFDANWKGRRYH